MDHLDTKVTGDNQSAKVQIEIEYFEQEVWPGFYIQIGKIRFNQYCLTAAIQCYLIIAFCQRNFALSWYTEAKLAGDSVA